MCTTIMQNLPKNLYKVASIVQLEQIAINQYGIPAYELMQRAGKAVFDVIQSRYPDAKKILVLCGAGNNAGDGYVVAKLAIQAAYTVRVISLAEPASLKDAAQQAYQDYLAVGSEVNTDLSSIAESEVIVDALLGTGFTRPISTDWAALIKSVNDCSNHVVSVDIPSGLYADTGSITDNEPDSVIKADVTVTFIGLKQGMFTALAKDYCGEIIYSDLSLPHEIFTQLPCDAQLINELDYALLPERNASSHKGCFGHVLIVGGNNGMPGAVILAARAALCTGAGLVTIVTIPQHLAAISDAVPEAMIKTCMTTTDSDLLDGNNISVTGSLEAAPSIEALFKQDFISDVTHIAVGMGIGQDAWSLALLQRCVQLNKPLLIDADALNLIAKNQNIISELLTAPSLIITPHPGEASRLLSTENVVSITGIQNNRFDAIARLRELFSDKVPCTVVLKGSGSLIFSGDIIKVCLLGNAAMSAPGMGDVLSGIVVSLMAQGVLSSDAVDLGVCLHASAAQSVSKGRTRGLLASDVISGLATVLR